MKSKHQKKQRHFVEQNPFETIMGGVKQSVVEDLGKNSMNDIMAQLLGKVDSQKSAPEHHGGDLSAGEEINFETLKKATHELTEMGEDFRREIIHADKIATNEDSREISVKVQEILIEIKQLAQSSEELKDKVEVISLEQATEKPGKYHLSFVETMLSWIREARMNVEDSLAWFGALRSKKAAKQYGAMSKKHGTTFSLSNERVVATQTG